MRIHKLTIARFRGAADPVSLDAAGKSIVIYGENGSGKSSFVDALEYLMTAGKIGHLAHEYSGKHQEKGLINTHIKPGEEASIELVLAGGSSLVAHINSSGSCDVVGAAVQDVAAWPYHQTVLRQDEVATFIRDTKGAKYSALLPLLGLHALELAAENLRQLAKAVEKRAKPDQLADTMHRLLARRQAAFGDDSTEVIANAMKGFHTQLIAKADPPVSLTALCDALHRVIALRTNDLSMEERRHMILSTIANLRLASDIALVRQAAQDLAAASESLVSERIAVLETASAFAAKLSLDSDVVCPACGQSIPANEFVSHVEGERARLGEVQKAFDRHRNAVARVCQGIESLKDAVRRPELADWVRATERKHSSAAVEYLLGIDVDILRKQCDDNALSGVEQYLLPLVQEAGHATQSAPIDAKTLAEALTKADAARDIEEGERLAAYLKRTQVLVKVVQMLEVGVRQEIRARAGAVIEDISSDIERMWLTLHPKAAITATKLYFSDDADKAIDVQLRFHGVTQDSPRLTLSEGYRNSLGLCIFLSMALRAQGNDRPLVLDDVVVSLDRNHRGMIVELLSKEFANRQILLLTHDREWYTELRHQLETQDWSFLTLVPYDSPAVGIRWSTRTSTLDDAKAYLQTAPDAAGNTARKIMDIELALLAERLRLRLPYLHGYKNDHRTGQDFLTRIIADAQTCFKRRTTAQHEAFTEAIRDLKETQRLLVSWGNRASHTFDVVAKEAEKLIESCERALKHFSCASCGKAVHRLDDATSNFLQCHCGELRWRYGKS